MERYATQVEITLECFDRVVITGTLVHVARAGAINAWLAHEGIRCFDVKEFADPLRRQMCVHAGALARQAGREVEFIRAQELPQGRACRNHHEGARQASWARACVQRDGTERRSPAAGCPQDEALVGLGLRQTCTTFEPWHDRNTGRTGMRSTSDKCLHFYFYFMYARLGLMYVRMQTWLPCRLHIYFDGHNALALQLTRAGIGHKMADNAAYQVVPLKKSI